MNQRQYINTYNLSQKTLLNRLLIADSGAELVLTNITDSLNNVISLATISSVLDENRLVELLGYPYTLTEEKNDIQEDVKKRLSESAWSIGLDSNLSVAKKNEWLEYRETLWNMLSLEQPKYTEVIWPVEPTL